MAKTNEEYMYVHNREELDQKVRYLVERGGVVQDQREDEVVVYVKKKMNIVVLVVGLILCLVPGLAYLIWYTTADQNQVMHVKIGRAPNLGGYHPKEEYDTATGSGGAAAGSAPPPAGLPPQDAASQIPTMPNPQTDAMPASPPPAPPPPSTGPPESF